MNQKINLELLFIGHPRCGSGFCANFCNKLGLNICHENHFGKMDITYTGLSSWAFVVNHYDKDNLFPRWGNNGDGWRKNFEFKNKIVYIRNPIDSLPAIMNENDHNGSFNLRSKYIEKELNKKINGNKLEKAILILIYWYKILEKRNDINLFFRIEYDLEKLVNYLKNINLITKNININDLQINKSINHKTRYYSINLENFENINPSIKKKFNKFCIKYKYKTIEEYYKEK